MKKTSYIIAFFLFSSFSFFGNGSFMDKDVFMSDRCVDKLSWFCLYGDTNYSVSGSVLEAPNSLKNKMMVNNETLFLNTERLAPLSLLYLHSENYSDIKTKSLESKIRNTNGEHRSRGLLPKVNPSIIFQEYIFNTNLRSVDINSNQHPFYELRLEGFGIRLRI
ncbi:hypothetical protein [Aquimarina sp. MMG016]|uniref:hypothetical protein n=1 Tax=Aquimarina sp. MMG016 TaxID=2822690 RepID=UPI001B3A764C|nr:hypothetical protein [Aquimarina sp. MMG016]MBQ4820816.1 hypothetical protein [Aquimarina sp. MMG016]